MTSEPAHTTLKEVILCQSTCPNNQLHNGKEGGQYALFSAMPCPL